MKKLVSAILAGALCASLLTACGGSSSASNPSAQTGSNTSINIGIGSDLTSLDPHAHNDVASAYGTRHIYDNLVRLDESTGEYLPQLAENWEYTSDTDVAFTLKSGVKFHNGEILNSADVKFSLERQKESAKVGHLVSMIDSVEVVDDTHFIIHLTAPSNALMAGLNHPGGAILCKSYTEGLEAEGKTLESAPMGCGPYKFEQWTPGSNFSLVKYDEYHDAEHAAQNDKLTFKVIPELSSRTIALENGEIDLLTDVSTTDANRIRENSKLALDEYTSTHIEYFCMNVTKAPFDNVKVRQAMNYAINKDDVVIAAVDGEGTPTDNYIGPAAIGYYDTVTKYEYNPEKAKELLAEAGYADGFSFSVMLSGDVRSKSATVIQANLAELGITMSIETMESSTFYEKTANGDHIACMSGWVAASDPDITYRPLFASDKAGAGGNRSFYQNPEVDKLIDDAAVNSDPAVVQSDYETVLKTLSDDAVWVPLYAKNGLVARQASLQGFTPSSISMHDFYNLHY